MPIDAEGLEKPTFLVHSAGAGAVLQFALAQPDRVGPLVLESPMSPYGFGGTRDLAGTPCWDDFAGSGGGTANPEFVAGIAAGDRSADSPASPRNVLRAFYVAPSYDFADEEDLLDSLLSTRIGDEHYPGPTRHSENWPGVAPAPTGMNTPCPPPTSMPAASPAWSPSDRQRGYAAART